MGADLLPIWMLRTELCLEEEVHKPSHTAVWEEEVVIARLVRETELHGSKSERSEKGC